MKNEELRMYFTLIMEQHAFFFFVYKVSIHYYI